MKILSIVPPSRLPTIVPDPGKWWSSINDHTLLRFSLNASWWRSLCSPTINEALQLWKAQNKTTNQFADVKIEKMAQAANESLTDLTSFKTYNSSSRYIETILPLSRYISVLNKMQTDIYFGMGHGAHVLNLDYDNSQTLVDFSKKESVLSLLIEDSLKNCSVDANFVTLAVTCPQDLLTALITARMLRKLNEHSHICLADHGYENYSLHPYLDKLLNSRTLTNVFDTIIVSKDDRDKILPDLINAVSTGNLTRGYLTLNRLPSTPTAISNNKIISPNLIEAFTPEPIFLTRVSPRKCYWSRCTFCVQNLKYDDPSPPSLSEISSSLDQIEAHVQSGYKNFIFADEALSPALLHKFCDEIIKRNIKFRWACRCKLELSHTKDLFEKMSKAGCYEILYGLESISSRVLKLMDKHVEGLSKDRIKEILKEMSDLGIGAHVNLIAAFPGDTVDEVEETIDFIIDSLSKVKNGTFTLNRFALFPDTPIFKNPENFGLNVVGNSGDIPSRYKYSLRQDLQLQSDIVDKELGRLQNKLFSYLGWSSFNVYGQGADDAINLYLGTGHGAIFKTQPETAFANPLKCSDKKIEA